MQQPRQDSSRCWGVSSGPRPASLPSALLHGLVLCAMASAVGWSAPASGEDAGRALCAQAAGQADVQVVCPPCDERTVPLLQVAAPSACTTPRPHSYVPGCPLRTPTVLSAEGGVAKAALVVAFAEYPELTNANYQALTAQVDEQANTQALCDAAKGLWVPNTGECRVRPRVRIEPRTLAEDTCEWCCSCVNGHGEAIWKGQSEGPSAGCMVPSYVLHRGLAGSEGRGRASRSGALDPLHAPARLRSYGFGRDPELSPACLNDPTGCGELDFGFPGWAMVLRKGCAPGQQVVREGRVVCDESRVIEPEVPLPNNGDRLELALYNLMPSDGVPDDLCNPVNRPDPADVHPNCFHGNDVTNLHFHGSHVSPQPHQDFVGLELKPRGSTDTGGHGAVAVGRYNIALDPITWRQAEGTHWYHPHKHGSTALQVINGLAGPLIIKGPFDDFIEEQVFGAAPGSYPTSLAPEDKILVVQAISDELNLASPARFDRWNTPWAMVNGQFQPTIRMQPGEVQRWRLIGATQDSSAHVELFLDGGAGLDIRQIAQDGVQVPTEVYWRSAEASESVEFWQLAPGNRIDLLVRADPSMAGQRLELKHRPNRDLPVQSTRRRFVGDSSAVFPLFFVEICDPRRDPSCRERSITLPGRLPELPPFLRPVETEEIALTRTLTFDQTEPPAGAQRDGAREPKKVARFQIDSRQYDPHCFNQTLELGRAEQWQVVNTTVMNHPLHVHVNPFQVTKMRWARPATEGVNRWRMEEQTFDPPVWRDTIALPTAETPLCLRSDGSPAAEVPAERCRAEEGFAPPRLVDGTPLVVGEVIPGELTLRTRVEDFTGPFVLHCHILGHEDRGMMQNVQSLCPTGGYARPASYGIDPAGNFVPEEQLRFLPFTQRVPECTAHPALPPLPAGPRCPPRGSKTPAP